MSEAKNFDPVAHFQGASVKLFDHGDYIEIEKEGSSGILIKLALDGDIRRKTAKVAIVKRADFYL